MILGLILLSSLILFFSFKTDSHMISEKNSYDSKPIQLFVESCIEKTLIEGIEEEGFHNITCLEEYLDNKIKYCTDSFNMFSGLNILEGDINASLILSKDNKTISANINYPLVIEDFKSATKISNFHIDLNLVNTLKIPHNGTSRSQIMLSSSDKNARLIIPKGTSMIGKDEQLIRKIKVKIKDATFHSNPFRLSYDFSPDGTTFSPYAIIEIKYKDKDNDGIIDGTTIKEDNTIIRYFDTGSKEWKAIPSEVDTDNNIIKAKITHFTEFEITQKVFDWRDIDGKNWMTEVKDGGNPITGEKLPWNCGETALMGLMEANYNIQVRKEPDFNFDLSEGDFFFCAKNLYSDLDYFGQVKYLKDIGAVEESCSGTCFSYQQCCSSLADNCKRYFIKDFQWTYDRETIKKWLKEIGPIMVGFCLPHDEEFDERGVGICDAIGKSQPGGYSNNYNCRSHAGVISGYNEEEEYWIVKNNQGPTSGGPQGDGYVRIGYGECWIDSGPFPGMVGTEHTLRADPSLGDGSAIAITLT